MAWRRPLIGSLSGQRPGWQTLRLWSGCPHLTSRQRLPALILGMVPHLQLGGTVMTQQLLGIRYPPGEKTHAFRHVAKCLNIADMPVMIFMTPSSSQSSCLIEHKVDHIDIHLQAGRLGLSHCAKACLSLSPLRHRVRGSAGRRRPRVCCCGWRLGRRWSVPAAGSCGRRLSAPDVVQDGWVGGDALALGGVLVQPSGPAPPPE